MLLTGLLRMLGWTRIIGRATSHATRFCSSSSAASALPEALKERIQKLLKAEPVVVFMKGTQQEPMCGFSKNVKLVSSIIHVFAD
ncbi:unnamed protein product [Gongylonema pulchrum]|uniref:Glutaredoxin domain-containing protein n=1 Tax=Gongylonema pulchrum TaxID=637853 RepID=A0A183EVD2_9BILA|nr:unnamed protein product [Gongylonema pulchrum]